MGLLNKQPSIWTIRNTLIGIFLITCITSVTSQSKNVKIPPINFKEDQVDEEKYKRYGAYYDCIDVKFISNIDHSNSYAAIDVYTKIHIVTTDGAQYGTIPIYRYSRQISTFEPKLYTAENEEVPLDVSSIFKQYLQSGKVVFPKVTAGSVLTIKISFMKGKTFYSSIHHNFSKNIPIRAYRFTHVQDWDALYDYKTYGTRYSIDTATFDNAKTWTVYNYIPQPRLSYLDYATYTEPRLIVRLVKVRLWDWSYNTNKRIIKDYVKKTNKISPRLTKRVLKGAKGHIGTQLERAQKILHYIQKTFSTSGKEKMSTKKMLKFGNASDLQIAALCHASFKKAGIHSKIVITSDKQDHVFDTTFLLLNNYLYTALPVLSIAESTYVAYPYKVGYELGEYPITLNESSCLDLDKEMFSALPAPRWGSEHIEVRRVLDFREVPTECRYIYTYSETNASMARAYFHSLDEEEQKRYFVNKLDESIKLDKVISFSSSDYKNCATPFRASITFSSNYIPIEYKNKKIVNVGIFFDEHLRALSTKRKEAVTVYNDYRYCEDVEVVGDSKSFVFDDPILNRLKRNPIDNDLFSSKVSAVTTDSSYVISRKLHIKKSKISTKDFSGIVKQCKTLNSLRSSTLSF